MYYGVGRRREAFSETICLDLDNLSSNSMFQVLVFQQMHFQLYCTRGNCLTIAISYQEKH